MQESKRQKQVARLIQEELTFIFQKLNLSMMNGGMVSISKVTVTPDLLGARISISLFQVNDNNATLESIKEKTNEIRGILGNKLRHQLRRIPELQFFLDDTLDYVFKMENLFKDLHNTDTKNEDTSE